MVEGKINRLPLLAQHTSRIASIGHVEMSGSDEENVGSASCVLGDLIGCVLAPLLVKFLGNFRLEQLFVHQLEGEIERIDVILFLIGFKVDEDISELAFHVLTNLVAWIKARIPPWPSKTAKREFPSLRSGLWIAASSIVFLQPEWTGKYLAFRKRRRCSLRPCRQTFSSM